MDNALLVCDVKCQNITAWAWRVWSCQELLIQVQARLFRDMIWVDGEHQLSAAGRGRVATFWGCSAARAWSGAQGDAAAPARGAGAFHEASAAQM